MMKLHWRSVTSCILTASFALCTNVNAADPAGTVITLNNHEFHVLDLGVRGAATFSMATTPTGFVIASTQGSEGTDEGTKSMKLLKVDAGTLSPPAPIEDPVITGAVPPKVGPFGRVLGSTIRLILASGKVAGIADQQDPARPQSRAFAPTPDGTGYAFLPPPDPRQCGNDFNAVGTSDIWAADAAGSMYGFFVAGKGDKYMGQIPVRWSIVRGAWFCQALVSDISGLSEREFRFGAATGRDIFLDVHKNEAPTLVVPCRSESAGMLPGAEAYQIQTIDIVHQVDQSFRVGRILDAQGKNVVGICWKEDEPKALNPVIWPGSLKNAKVIDAVKANEVRGGAVIGDSMFITTALAGKATTMAFTADAQVDVETSGLTINSIVCKSSGGFVAKGSMKGLAGYWLVTGK